MRKSISPLRREYDHAYRLIRQFGEELFHDCPFFPATTAEECALESRDWNDSHFSGRIPQRSDEWHEKYSDRYPMEYYQF